MALLALLALLADPDPPVWPEKFTADQTIVTTFKERPAKTFYDYSVPAQRTEQDGWCMPLFIGQTAKKWSCSFLILPAGIYHVAPDAKGMCSTVWGMKGCFARGRNVFLVGWLVG